MMNIIYKTAIEAAVQAGKEILTIYMLQDYQVELKSDNSPVTQADRKSSEIISRYLKETRIPVIDEEIYCTTYSERQLWSQLWLVDPMDGTKEFISRNGEFTVNIALVENNVPVFGVIFSPVLKELFFGGPEIGSFRVADVPDFPENYGFESSRVKLRPVLNRNNHLRVAVSRSHLDNKTKIYIDKLKALNPDIDFLSKGSSLKLCLIADGLIDIYPRFSRTMEWDTAAGHAIVSGTGGVLLDAINGLPLQYNKEDLSNPSFIALSANMQFSKWLPHNLL